MSFPTSPINGQIAVVNNIAYEYATANSSWTRVLSIANIIQANVISANVLNVVQEFSIAGNIATANYFIGNGAFLTGLAATYSNANVANYLPTYTGNLVSLTGPVTTTGNITGNYILGNGACLTGVITSVANINNGTSNVTVTSSGGNVTVGVGGTSNVAVFATTGEYVTGLLSVSGNITGGNVISSGVRVYKWTTVANTAPSGAVPGDNWYDSYADKLYLYVNDGTSNTWVDQSFPTTFSNLTVSGDISTAGNVTALNFNSASADLAEVYSADAVYPPGTVLDFGGDFEVTVAQPNSSKIAGVVSTTPAYLMNSTLESANTVAVALIGRVPTLVIGPVSKGAMMVSAGNGYAQACTTPSIGTVIGKAVEDFASESGIIEIAVGKL